MRCAPRLARPTSRPLYLYFFSNHKFVVVLMITFTTRQNKIKLKKSLAQARGLFVADKHVLLGIGHIHPGSGLVPVQLKISSGPGHTFVLRKVRAW